MSQTIKGTGAKATGEAKLVRLVERALSPRVRTVLAGLLERTAYFESVLGLLFDELEQNLFKQADRARSNEQQLRLFEAIREIKRGKADIVPRFLAYLESSIAMLDQTASVKRPDNLSSPYGAVKLELVESGDLEISLAVQDIANKAEIRHSQALHLLGHRLGVIAGKPAFEAELMPLGPLALTSAMRYSLHEFDLGLNERILVFQAFDRAVMTPIGAFYDTINHYLAEQRVLPNLQFNARRESRGAGSPAAEAEATPVEKNAESSKAPAASPRQAPASPAPQQHPPSWAQDTSGRAGASAETPRPRSNGQQQPAPSDTDMRDSVLFSSLRGLLADRRRGLGLAGNTPASSYLASRDDLQSVLGSLQVNPPGTGQDGKPVAQNVGHLKQDLLKRLRESSPQGKAPVLAEEDSDTIDLVGMLFDYIGQNLGPQSGSRDLMAKLQVPVLRTALGDKDFFTKRNHPARMLLNSVAEASALWMHDDDPDQGFVDKMTSLVDRVSREFDGDMSLIEDLLGDLSRHMTQSVKRAEIAERRHIDAAKGREKLDLARERANTAVARLINRGKPTPMVRAVLEQAWTDVLALTILRQGEDSQNYRRRLAVADQLMQIGSSEDPVTLDSTLRDEVRNGLTQVGLHNDEVDGVVSKLFDPPSADKKTSHTEIAITLKGKTRLGVEPTPRVSAAATPAVEPEAPPPPLTAEEQKMMLHIRTLPFGSWFEFVTNQQGATVRRKLAWFSTVTGRCLFVNQRGARADEKTMEQLARDLVRGQVRIYNAESENIIDRAWKAIMNTLQQFSGSAAARPATA